jgi:tetratricopeptide (TPR) repeat protein
MKPHTPAEGVTPGLPAPSAPSRWPRRRWVVLRLALLLAGAAGGWWWWQRVEPPMPADVRDPEVRHAIEAARRKVLAERRSAAAWGDLGILLLAHLCTSEADFSFAEAARLDPADPRWPYYRGLIALKRDPDRALPFLRQALAVGAASPTYQSILRLKLAEALLDRGELDEAGSLFREERGRDPNSARAALGLGLIAGARGDHRAAIDFLLAARVSPFARKTATQQLAAAARGLGDDRAAAAYDQEAADLPNDPPWPDPLAAAAAQAEVGHRGRREDVEQLEQEERYAEAADLYRRQHEQAPTARTAVGVGVNLAHLGDFDGALPYLREAVRLDPNDSTPHYRLAQALVTRALKERSRAPEPARKEWLREAVAEARRATELKRDHALAFLIWGQALLELGEPAAAVDPLRRGVACRPEVFDLHRTLGEALLQAGQAQEAEKSLENARKLRPKDRRTLELLDQLKDKKGAPPPTPPPEDVS